MVHFGNGYVKGSSSRSFDGIVRYRRGTVFRDNDAMHATTLGGSDNGPKITHIGNLIQQQKER